MPFAPVTVLENGSVPIQRPPNPQSDSNYRWKVTNSSLGATYAGHFNVVRDFPYLTETGTLGRDPAALHLSTTITLYITIGKHTPDDYIVVTCPDVAALMVTGPLPAGPPANVGFVRKDDLPPRQVPVTAVIRRHRGVPNLPLLSCEAPDKLAKFRLVPHHPNPKERSIAIDAKVRSADRLEIDLAAVDLKSADLRALDLEETSGGKTHKTPVTIHVCSDTIVLVDRSARMLENMGDGACGSRYTAAVRAANLFAQLNALAVPDLVTEDVDLPAPNRLAFGTFFTDRDPVLSLSELEPGSNAQCLAADGQPETYYGSALGAALERAARALPAAEWRQRHIVVVTSGLDEQDSECFDAHVACIPSPKSDPGKGVHVHVIVVGRAGETEDPRLWRLARSHSGQYFNMGASPDLQGESALIMPFLNVLKELLPVEIMAGANERALMVENGVDHVLFAARTTAGCCDELLLENLGVTTRPRKASCDVGFTFSDTYLAVPGTWRVPRDRRQRQMLAIAEARLDFRCSAAIDTSTQLARLEATLRYRGEPVSGASVRAVALRQPMLLGAELTRFAREGGIAEALRLRTFDAVQFCSSQSDGALRRALLDAMESAANFEFRASPVLIALEEREEGYYVATMPDRGPGVTAFRFRADGETQLGSVFSRTAEVTVLSPAVPDAAGSFVWFDMFDDAEGSPHCRVTALFKAALRAGGSVDLGDEMGMGMAFEMGPGLGREVGLAYAPSPGGVPAPIELTDNWDGTYSAIVECTPGHMPSLVATYKKDDGTAAFVPLGASPGTTQHVVVTLLEVQYEFPGEGAPAPTSAVVVTAPNASYPRSASQRIELDEACRGASLPRVVFDGHVEDGAMMFLALGDPSLDYFAAFDDASQTDVQLASLAPPHQEIRSSGDARTRWRVRYSIDVTASRTIAPGSTESDESVDSPPVRSPKVSVRG